MRPDRHPSSMRIPRSLVPALRERGFQSTAQGWKRNGLRFEVHGRWFVFSERGDEATQADPWLDLRQIGLWKQVQSGTKRRRVFEIPSWVVCNPADGSDLDGTDLAPFDQILDWMLASASGRIRCGWQPPAHEVMEASAPRGALTLQVAGLVRQGEFVLRPDRLAVRIPLLPQLPAELPADRARALRELLFDAQSRWAMLRFGICEDASPRAVVADFDLTGAPHCDPLISAGVDVLRHVCARLAETVDALADASVVLRSLALDRDQTQPNERNEP